MPPPATPRLARVARPASAAAPALDAAPSGSPETAAFARRDFLAPPLSGPALLQAWLPPLAAIATLAFCARLFGQALAGPHVMLAALLLALALPMRAPAVSGGGFSVARPVIAWGGAIALLLLLGDATGLLQGTDRRVLLAWLLATPPVLLAGGLLLPRLLAGARAQPTAVIVGSGPLADQLTAALARVPGEGVRVAGHFEDRRAPRRPRAAGAPPPAGILGTCADVAAYVKRHRIDRIYITLPMAAQPRILQLLDALRDTTASVYFAPDIFLADLIQARVDTVGGMPVLAVCETPFSGVNGLLKRASDLLLGSLILLLIAPLLLAVAVAVRLDSPGPVLFRQRRYGLDGQEIVVYKFRTMRVAEDGDVIRQATRDDPRVTRLGAFLRRTSLDELPQFFNVLAGTMSIVGPRPHAVAHNEQYRRLIKGYMLRHKVRPGITGWAQVNGQRGETDTVEKMQKRVEYDLAYLRHWSLLWDLEIILRTVFVVLGRRNAY